MKLSPHAVALSIFFVIISLAELCFASDRGYLIRRENKDIVVMTCPKGLDNSGKACAGSKFENIVSAYAFQEGFQTPYLIEDADKIKPLTFEEDKIYRSVGIDPQKILDLRKQNLLMKLKKIEDFYKKQNQPAKILKKIKTAQIQLESSNPIKTDVLNLNLSTLQIFEDIYKRSTQKPAFYKETKADQSFWRQFDSSIPECGTSEKDSLNQRLAQCATIVTVDGTKKWSLLARQRNETNGRYFEVWKDHQTGLIWGDLSERLLAHYFVLEQNSKGHILQEKHCMSPQYQIARAGIKSVEFFTPTIEELEKAVENGMDQVVPNMNRWQWSASEFPNGLSDVAWGLSGGAKKFRDFDFKYYYSSVRCVSRAQAL